MIYILKEVFGNDKEDRMGLDSRLWNPLILAEIIFERPLTRRMMRMINRETTCQAMLRPCLLCSPWHQIGETRSLLQPA